MQLDQGLLVKMINENRVLEYTDIEKLIPHRAPFLLIDKLTNAVPGVSATGIKAVSGGESYFAGHFPSNPVMPGVLIVEAMAQVAACVASFTLKDDQKDTLVFFCLQQMREAKCTLLYSRSYLEAILDSSCYRHSSFWNVS